MMDIQCVNYNKYANILFDYNISIYVYYTRIVYNIVDREEAKKKARKKHELI